jgi:type IV pilus assembly protein PilA
LHPSNQVQDGFLFMKRYQGFSLVELLIVVTVIAIVAAIAIPNLLAARRAANEGSAVSTLRTLYGANVSYAATTGSGNYAGLPAAVGVSSLNDLYAAGLIDGVLNSGQKSGFDFVGDRAVASATEPQTFYFAANPITTSGILMSGTKRYGVATDGVLHYDGTPADLGTPFDALTLDAALGLGE